ncbi:MAG TPA: hypothetical protein VL123_01545 [Candidatus Udaeobacter sp.]|nr:hypothetical protein [Candidatus Udaeobacter sp.]
MSFDERDEARLGRLLRTVGAESDDRAWSRARARLSARDEVPSWLSWALRPAALAAAAALLVVSVGTSVWWLEGASRQNVAEQLLAAGGANTSADFEVDLPSGAVNDSGAMQ